MNQREYRNINQITNKENSRIIEGYAIRFNELSKNLGFYETISPTAMDEEFLKKQDVLALFDHNQDRGILARYNKGVGNLNLELRKDGLYYSFEALPTALGDEVLAYVRSGIIGGSSFAFSVADDEDAQKWERRSDGKVYRTINKFEGIYDVSPVLTPAYSTSTCTCRSFDKFKAKEKEELLNKLENLKKDITNL